MNRGGARTNAGRKSNGEIAKFRELLDANVSDTDWGEIIKAAVTDAKGHSQGAGLARTWLSSYRFGVPTQRIEQDVEVKEITIIEVEAIERPRGNKRKRKDTTATASRAAASVAVKAALRDSHSRNAGR